MYRKFCLAAALVCAGGLLISCSKNGKDEVVNQQTSSNVSKIVEAPEVVEVPVVRDPRFDDLDSVLEKMSDRFKGEVRIPELKYEDFLESLESALLTEKDNDKDDISIFFLIDKTHYAGKNNGKNYVPTNVDSVKNCSSYSVNKSGLSLRHEAAEALKVLGNAAKEDGVNLTVSSTYRSYSYQQSLFQHWVDVDGLEEAERESARAGTSQHQLGVAVDFAPVDDAFADTQAGKWVYENAARYGWSLSFPKDHEDVTGYRWESWHFRYFGVPAVQLQKNWFFDIQQYMLEFIDEWKKTESYKKFAAENEIPDLVNSVTQD